MATSSEKERTVLQRMRPFYFVTVGTDRPFERFVQAVDEWAARNPGIEIFGQIGKTNYTPKNFEHKKFLPSEEFSFYINKSELVISHAGMGTILSALKSSKPVLIFPRHHNKQETANSHQIDTAAAMQNLGYSTAAATKEQLHTILDSKSWRNSSRRKQSTQTPEIITFLRKSIKRLNSGRSAI